MATFVHTSKIPASARDVFAWHQSPDALARLIPPWESVRIEKPPASLQDGETAILWVPAGPFRKKWVARHHGFVDRGDEGGEFTDEQVSGPFASWRHRHVVRAIGPDWCVLEDRIEYALPLGWLGAALAGWYVRRKLERMFAYRHAATGAAVTSGRLSTAQQAGPLPTPLTTKGGSPSQSPTGGDSGAMRATKLVALNGGADAWLEIDEDLICWECAATGRLMIRALRGDYHLARPVTAFLMSLGNRDARLLDSREVVSAPVTIREGEHLSAPIRLEIPWGAPLDQELRLFVNLRPATWHEEIEVRVRAAPPSGCLALIEQFGLLTNTHAVGWREDEHGRISVAMEPDGSQHLLQHAHLILERADQAWRGVLELTLDHHILSFDLPPLPSEPEALRTTVQWLLQDAGIEPWRAWDYPIPSGAPDADARTLPRPAHLDDAT